MSDDKINIVGRIKITPEVEMALGIPASKIRMMSLREFAKAAFDKGYICRVHMPPEISDDPGLTIRVEHNPQGIPFQ